MTDVPQNYRDAKSGVVRQKLPPPITGPVWVNTGERDEATGKVIVIKKEPGKDVDWEKGERKNHGDPDPTKKTV